MTRQRGSLIVAFILVLTAVFSVGDQRSAGQQQFPPSNRKPACTIFCGGSDPNPRINYFDLFTKEEISAGTCYGGPLPADSANNYYNELSEGERNTLCKNLETANAPTRECPAFKRLAFLCENAPRPKNECEKPTPWFGPPSSDCKDVQSPVVAINAGALTLSICGFPVFWSTPSRDPEILELNRKMVTERVKERVGSKVCCDRFREAAKTGTPCYPGVDVDCDGKDNKQDGSDMLPDINDSFSTAEKGSFDRFPQGLDPDDTEFFPPQGKCDCKWQLIKGTLNCSPDGRQRHFYEAIWKCPATGNEITTRKYAPATAPCTP